MAVFESDFEIRYSDVDTNNRLSNISLLNLLVDIAGMHSDSVGYGLTNINETNITFLLLGWKVKVFRRPHSLEKIHVKTWAKNLIRSFSSRDFEVTDKDNNLVALASSKWVIINVDTHTIGKITPEISKAYDATNKSVFDEDIKSLKAPETVDSTFEYTIQRRDIDSNNHVNNVKYLEFAYEALPEDLYNNFTFSSLDIMYKNECKLGYDIVCNYTKLSDSEHVVVIKSKDQTKLHAIVKFTI